MERTQPIAIRLVEMHDEMGDRSYRDQRISETDHVDTVRLPVITDADLATSSKRRLARGTGGPK